ncbi:MAG: helix-turn-helix domain-containing protein [Alphaproteobacteria bacterium]|jgi:TetR/AcrR family transcriptional regulator, lmrAB and yxaGH operons repressor|nr:helix-turn-helix domain-containing protein [Alphaproteobacteria bacterium]
MPAPRAHRERLVEASADLIQRKGYHSTGLAEILTASGAPRGSLYHYFPGGKEDLACEAIALSAAKVMQTLATVTKGARSPTTALNKIADHFAGQLTASNFEKGCPVATITLELAGDSTRIQEACAAAYAAWQAGIEAMLVRAGIVGAKPLAETLLMTLEGALLLSRARRDCAPLRLFKRHAAQLLGDAR